jgi:hypothetical protein
MASGVLGRVSLASTTLTTVYTVPIGNVAYLNVTLANRSSASAAVRVALAQTAASPLDAEYIEYETDISGNGVLERTGLILGAGWSVVAYSDSAAVSVMTYGIEQSNA